MSSTSCEVTQGGISRNSSIIIIDIDGFSVSGSVLGKGLGIDPLYVTYKPFKKAKAEYALFDGVIQPFDTYTYTFFYEMAFFNCGTESVFSIFPNALPRLPRQYIRRHYVPMIRAMQVQRSCNYERLRALMSSNNRTMTRFSVKQVILHLRDLVHKGHRLCFKGGIIEKILACLALRSAEGPLPCPLDLERLSAGFGEIILNGELYPFLLRKITPDQINKKWLPVCPIHSEDTQEFHHCPSYETVHHGRVLIATHTEIQVSEFQGCCKENYLVESPTGHLTGDCKRRMVLAEMLNFPRSVEKSVEQTKTLWKNTPYIKGGNPIMWRKMKI
ncbi:Uncharacterised protein r2_g1053 [Pycnogonum litorale]